MKIGVLGLKGRMGQILQKEMSHLNWECLELCFDKNKLIEQQEGLDGIIEFSSKEALSELIDAVNVPCVLASTGLTDEIKEKILLKSQKVPIFYSANFSMGFNKLLYILKSAGLDPLNAEIFERHHIHKKDAPSGTALTLKKELNIPKEIISIREGEVFGEHEIHYYLEGETLIFKHIAENRNIFAIGACRALKFLVDKKPGLYGMQDLLNTNGVLLNP